MALPDLGRFVDAPVEELIEGPSGRSYRLQIDSFSKPEEKDSHVHVRIRLRGLGWRRYQRYTGAVLRGAPEETEDEEPGEEPGITSRWGDLRDRSLLVAILALAVMPWLIGVGFLISLLI
jgi:hypothetical protein